MSSESLVLPRESRCRQDEMERAEGEEEGGDQRRLRHELREQRPAGAEVEGVKRDLSGLRPVPIKREENLLEKESGVNLGSLTAKQTYSEQGMKLCLWLIENSVNLIKQEVQRGFSLVLYLRV